MLHEKRVKGDQLQNLNLVERQKIQSHVGLSFSYGVNMLDL